MSADPRSLVEPQKVIEAAQIPQIPGRNHAEYWRQEFLRAQSETNSAAALIELLANVESCDNLGLACSTLVNQLQRYLGCKQVILGLCRRNQKSCQLQSISGTLDFDSRSERVRLIQAAFDEAIVRGSLSVWPPLSESDRHALMTHKQLAASMSSGSVVSSLIRDEEGRVQGAWLFLGDDRLRKESENINFIQASERCIGSCLHLLQRAELGRFNRLMTKLLSVPRRWKGGTACVAALLLSALMAVPFPYKVKCQCELQPVLRRFVAAPFDGSLENTFVEPGDVVSKNQLLAKMDGREVRWELAGVSADFNRAAKQRDSHLADHAFGAVQLSNFEMERLELKTRLLKHRGERLDIRSPSDGIVINGDLKKAEGMPVAIGQTLYEIAPLDNMLVEVAIPEDDIAHVSTGLPVQIVIDAYPDKVWRGTLGRIHPRSEIKEHEHVFIGQVNLKNDDKVLHPGMQGRAKIIGCDHPLGWNLFHKP